MDNEVSATDRAIACIAIGLFAWWKDGTQYVGITGMTYKKAKEECLAGNYDDALFVAKMGLDPQVRRG
jgi:hypothetical protein